jgi:hypothetical protein
MGLCTGFQGRLETDAEDAVASSSEAPSNPRKPLTSRKRGRSVIAMAPRFLLPVPFLLLAVLSLAVTGAKSGSAQTGSLTVTPASGPIGTYVTITGSGCNNPGQATSLSFESGDAASGLTGTLGAAGTPGLARIPTSADGAFTATFTIPASFEQGSPQGLGGGPLVPGVYRFRSHPPICEARFTVTAFGPLPDTGGDPRPHAKSPPAVWVALIGLFFVGSGAVTLIRRP